MDRILEEKLRTKYRRMFKHYLRGRHIDCYDGWHDIIEHMLYQLKEATPHIDVIQIKQKFARLTVYYAPQHPLAETIINEAEYRASTACELCGKYVSGSLIKNNYRWTIHDECLNNKSWRDIEDYHLYEIRTKDNVLIEFVEFEAGNTWMFY